MAQIIPCCRLRKDRVYPILDVALCVDSSIAKRTDLADWGWNANQNLGGSMDNE